jgi:hypothetical protein
MNILMDVLVDLVGGAVGAETERGLVGTFTTGAAVILAFAVWVVMGDPVRQSTWVLGAFVASILVGSGGVFLALLHWNRNPSDRLFAVICAAFSGAAVAFPVLWVVIR